MVTGTSSADPPNTVYVPIGVQVAELDPRALLGGVVLERTLFRLDADVLEPLGRSVAEQVPVNFQHVPVRFAGARRDHGQVVGQAHCLKPSYALPTNVMSLSHALEAGTGANREEHVLKLLKRHALTSVDYLDQVGDAIGF